ncbi:MAG: hypothetical protein ABI680_06065 [Chthoniobacteraceae bacterium]
MKHSPFHGTNPAGSLFSGIALLFTAASAHAVLFDNFNEAGSTVNGYQDDFTGTSLNPD